ncbi:MAG: hypothetical protein JF606_25075 [Burkholderiales bacterium]|nr:hypothetical protein [Burkholderiales bacterium]
MKQFKPQPIHFSQATACSDDQSRLSSDVALVTPVQLTSTWPLPAVAVTPIGAVAAATGTAGVAPLDWADADPSPAALSAATSWK